MNKFLLPAALLLLSAGNIYADELPLISDLFNITYKGQSLTPDATIEINDFTDASQLFGPNTVIYDADIEVENLDIMPAYINGTLSFAGQPTAKQYEQNRSFWGTPQLCYSVQIGDELPTGNCLLGNPPYNLGNGCVQVPVEGVGTFNWILHVQGANKEATSKYKLTLQAKSAETDGVALSQPITVTLQFSTADSGVDSIDAEADAATEWFDLQGRKVVNPEKGLYILRQGNKVSKRLVK